MKKKTVCKIIYAILFVCLFAMMGLGVWAFETIEDQSIGAIILFAATIMIIPIAQLDLPKGQRLFRKQRM